MAHMVPHVEMEANGNAALGGCCSRFSDEAVVIYKDDHFELREYNISCCTGDEKKKSRHYKRTIQELDRRFRRDYGVTVDEVCEDAELDVTEGITFVQFKAIHNQAFHYKLVRYYGVTLQEAIEALSIKIDPVKGLSSLEMQEIETWARRNGKQQATEYDAPGGAMPSLEEMPEKRVGWVHSLSRVQFQNEPQETETQRERLAGIIQRTVMQVVAALTPRQMQAIRQETEASRTIVELTSIEVKNEVENLIEVDI